MKLTMMRLISTTDETIGVLMIDNVFECFTLEDEYRPEKLVGETRIPDGFYYLSKRMHGGFYERYKARFGSDFHKYMIEVEDVNGFTDILFHCGNTDDDTSGCILVGDVADINRGLPGMSIGRSADAYRRVYQKVSKALDAGEKVVLTIIDRDIGPETIRVL